MTYNVMYVFNLFFLFYKVKFKYPRVCHLFIGHLVLFPTTLKRIKRHTSHGQTVELLKESRSSLSQVYKPKRRRSDGTLIVETRKEKCKYRRAR